MRNWLASVIRRRGLFHIITFVVRDPKEAKMRFKTMATITAAIFVIAGLGFTFWDLNFTRFYGVRDWLEHPIKRQEMILMLRMRSFVYMFGASLFGCGLLTWSIRNLKDKTAQTNASLALFGLNLLAGAFAFTQQHSIWKSKAGWITAGIFSLQAACYCWLLLMRPKASIIAVASPSDPS